MKMSDDELLAAIDAAEQAAIGTRQGEIATDRADAIDRYLGKPYGDEQKGRSQVVSRDVSDVVEGVCANVLKPFVGGDEVVKFEPRGPEDVEQSQQETDYINYVALERNNGFLILNTAVKDALLLRNGYVFCEWYKRDDVVLETYRGMTDDELAILLQDSEVEVVAHSDYPDPVAVLDQMPAPAAMSMGLGPDSSPAGPMLHDLKLRRKQPVEYVRTRPHPSDEILVSARLREPSLQDADFVQVRTHLTLSDLRQMDYDVPDDIGDDDDAETIEGYARQRFGTRGDVYDDETQDRSRRLVLFKESWMRIDRDGDGVAELRRICMVGKNILADEEADIIPIACFAAIASQHQHLAISLYDLIKDLAQIKTAITRQYLDNLYQANNQRSIVDVNRVNLDDFLVSRPGGVVRVDGDPTTAVVPLIAPDVGAPALTGLQYFDSVRENRTGFTRSAEGMKSTSLATGTLGELNQQLNQSTMRLEMISRTIAETGVRDLFRIVHALTLKHSTKAEKIRLRNQWVQVNPREWVKRTDLSISVGLGTSTAQQQMQNLMLIGQAQQQAMPMGLVQPRNVYNVLKKLAIAAGFKTPEEFFTEPQKDPQTGQDVSPPQQKDPLVQKAEIDNQGRMQLAQVESQTKAQEIQMQAMADEKRAGNELQVQQANDERELVLQKYKIDREIELEKYKINETIKADIIREQIKAQAAAEQASMNADLTRETTAIHVAGVDQAFKSQVLQRREQEKQAEKQAQQAESQELRQVLTTLAQLVTEVKDLQNAPREIVRGPDGRAAGVKVGNQVRRVNRGPDGKATGLQ